MEPRRVPWTAVGLGLAGLGYAANVTAILVLGGLPPWNVFAVTIGMESAGLLVAAAGFAHPDPARAARVSTAGFLLAATGAVLLVTAAILNGPGVFTIGNTLAALGLVQAAWYSLAALLASPPREAPPAGLRLSLLVSATGAGWVMMLNLANLAFFPAVAIGAMLVAGYLLAARGLSSNQVRVPGASPA